MDTTRALVANGLVTGDGAVLVDGAVVVDGRGVVLDVGRAADVLPRSTGAEVARFEGVLMPGLVNAHTHLELSALRGQVPGGAGFVPWVERLIGARGEHPPEEDAEAIARGVEDLASSGTVLVGDVSNSLAAVHALARRGIGGAVFHEVFGVQQAAVLRRVAALAAELEERVGAWPTEDLAYAPTPHTLYTTHPDAVRALLALGRARGGRMSLHLAEHAAERSALEHGGGPIPAWFEQRLKIPKAEQVWPGKGPIALADALGALAKDVLLVHLADARPEELDVVASRGAPAVLCPRSNLYIETRLPPLLAIRAAGIEAALGTDSLASNASLDVLAEARALKDRFAAVPAAELLRMATWNGARALGRDDAGRLARGARPGVLLVEAGPATSPLGAGDASWDPAAWVLANLRAPRRLVASRGQTGALP